MYNGNGHMNRQECLTRSRRRLRQHRFWYTSTQRKHRQQYRSRWANPNERVNDVTSPAGRDLQLAECVVHWIYCCVVQSRSCRLVAGMHSTSFVLGKGVGCLRSVFCVLVSNIDRLLAWAWCLLSAAFAVNSRHRTVAFAASLLRRSSWLGGRRSCR